MNLNLYRASEKLDSKITGSQITLLGLDVSNPRERRARLQSMVNGLVSAGIDSCVAPVMKESGADIVLIAATSAQLSSAFARVEKFNPQTQALESVDGHSLADAWQNRVRNQLKKQRLLRTGDKYVPVSEISNPSKQFKQAMRVQSVIEDGYPALWLDRSTRMMNSLVDTDIGRANQLRQESDVRVAVLPNWQQGLLVGTADQRAGDLTFPLGDRKLRTAEYWRIRHGIDFVSDDESMLNIVLKGMDKSLSYPKSCVYKAFERGTSLSSGLKRTPSERIEESRRFITKIVPSIKFAGQRFEFSSSESISTSDTRWKEFNYAKSSAFRVVVGNSRATNVRGIKTALMDAGPFSGDLDGQLIVIHPGHRDLAAQAVNKVQQIYSELNLGTLDIAVDIGNLGFVDTNGSLPTDFVSKAVELRSSISDRDKRLLAVVVLPSDHTSNVYYRSREKLFEPFFGYDPIPVQAITIDTVREIANGGRSAGPTASNLATQCYVKLGGSGYAPWVLAQPADTGIPGIQPGSTCYAFHDVSRRPTTKASTMAYSAMTDPWGRYVSTGAKPIGGESLTPTVFHDELVDIVHKITAFKRHQQTLGATGDWHFNRLLFGKDGVIKQDEAFMMEEVIVRGIPEEGKEPLATILKKTDFLSTSMTIDIISVNKSPNKRMFQGMGERFLNVDEGTGIALSDNVGLLVAAPTRAGTAQPLEISLTAHIPLNTEGIPRPHIGQIMEEYYRQTYLDWASLYMQGKYALCQILTQNLGENLSAGVSVPENMILI